MKNKRLLDKKKRNIFQKNEELLKLYKVMLILLINKDKNLLNGNKIYK